MTTSPKVPGPFGPLSWPLPMVRKALQAELKEVPGCVWLQRSRSWRPPITLWSPESSKAHVSRSPKCSWWRRTRWRKSPMMWVPSWLDGLSSGGGGFCWGWSQPEGGVPSGIQLGTLPIPGFHEASWRYVLWELLEESSGRKWFPQKKQISWASLGYCKRLERVYEHSFKNIKKYFYIMF